MKVKLTPVGEFTNAEYIENVYNITQGNEHRIIFSYKENGNDVQKEFDITRWCVLIYGI